MESVQLFLVLVAVFALPLALGQYLARAFRMPEQGWRIATVFFSLFAAAAVTWFGWPPRLGIDLRGGSQLVYEIDKDKRPADLPSDYMDKLITAVQKRVDPDGVQEVTIRRYGIDQIEIIIPDTDAEELERIKNRISSTGLLEFRITANERQHRHEIDEAKKLDPETKLVFETMADGSREEVARWVPLKEGARLDPSWATRKNSKDQVEVLVVIDQQNVNGGYLRSASAAPSEKGIGHKVDFKFRPEGARLFGKLTGDNLPQKGGNQEHFSNLAIILDGQLESAPTINSMITEAGEISGSFTPEQAEDLARVLTAGSLPTALYKDPSTSLTTGPTLGADTIRKGVNSMLVATLAVMSFMIFYYRFAGVVANIALLLNVLLIVAFMIIFRAAFTLSGLAGLALTVGMAVDANVLIYERMREELAKKATLRMAIRNGFGRATTTIIDANMTTLISAVVLYVMGTDQVKGFAITLILGIVMNLYTAIFVSRVIFDIAEKTRFIKQLNMLHILSNPNFEFISKWKIATAVSAVIIAIGFVGVYERGQGILDIDFTGGTSVEMLFAEPMETAKVRDMIEARSDELPDATVQDVKIQGEEAGVRFVINTSNQGRSKVENDDPDPTNVESLGESNVEKVLKQIFEGRLQTNHFEIVGPLAQITDASGKKPAESPAAGSPKPETPKTDLPKSERPKSETPDATTPADASADKPEPSGDKPEPAPSDSPQPDAPQTDASQPDAPKSGAARFRPEETQLIALADAQDKADPAAPTDAVPADKPAEKSADEKAPADKPSDEKASESKPIAEKPAADKPATEKPAADKPADSISKPPGAGGASLSAPSRLIGGTEAELKFRMPIGAQELMSVLIKGKIATPDADQDAVIEVDNEESSAKKRATKFQEWTVRTSFSQAQLQAVLDQTKTILASEVTFPASNQIGAKVADNTKQQALMAMAASLLLILAYVWFRFSQVMFGVAAVVAVIHDVLVTLGAIALSYWLAEIPGFDFLLVEPFKISLPIIAAFLTIIGYSLNDTIVIFDRIREARGKSPVITAELANRCINETLSRTILTSLTVFIVVLILYIAGGQAIHGFAFALVVGVVAGSYSTIYIATPIVLWMNRHAGDAKAKVAVTTPKLSQKTSTA